MPQDGQTQGRLASKNLQIADLFDLMGDVLEVQGENTFRIRAYRRAAQNLRSLSTDVVALASRAGLDEIPGIGADLAAKIEEYLATGRIAEIDAASKRVPSGVVALMRVPGIGPKTAKLLYEGEHITSLDQLERLARAGKLRGLEGIQAKTEQNILAGIAIVRGGQARMPLGLALPLGEEIVAALAREPATKLVSLAGSIRRRKDTVGDMDVLVTSTRPAAVMRAFTSLPQVAAVLERGTTKASVRHREGIQVDLRVVEPASFGAALLYFTGSKQHNIRLRSMAIKRGLKISEYGVFRARSGRRVAGETEEEVYRSLGLPWIPPEIREDSGEIEAALGGSLPALVELTDIRGDLHCHTNASDGHDSIESLVAAAVQRGYAYVAITDHSRSTRVAGGLTPAEVRAHVAKIRTVQKRYAGILVLAGTECDILPDGSLDYSDRLLADLDFVVAAVHSHFKQDRREMTARLCKALSHPCVRVLAHPTGRLIGKRPACDLDLDEVLRTAKRYGKALEINAHPERLDLCDVHARRAHELDVPVSIATDAHMSDDLACMTFGIATARRGWTEKGAVINSWPAERLRVWAERPAAKPVPGRRGRVRSRGARRDARDTLHANK